MDRNGDIAHDEGSRQMQKLAYGCICLSEPINIFIYDLSQLNVIIIHLSIPVFTRTNEGM